MAEKIINCTPHAVNLIAGSLLDPATGCRIGGHEFISFPPCGKVLAVTSTLSAAEPIMVNGQAIPTGRQSTAFLSPLPLELGDRFIVSNVYADAAKEMLPSSMVEKLLVPYEKVKDGKNGRVIGCTGLVTPALSTKRKVG